MTAGEVSPDSSGVSKGVRFDDMLALAALVCSKCGRRDARPQLRSDGNGRRRGRPPAPATATASRLSPSCWPGPERELVPPRSCLLCSTTPNRS
jgi:hypothetical protein